MKRKLDKAKRKAAGYLMMQAFHLQLNLNHLLVGQFLTPTRMVSPSLYEGLTPQERELIARWRSRGDKQAELYRVMAWRLLGESHVGSTSARKARRR